MPYNENVPRESNNRGDDLISMKNNFKYIKDAFNFLFSNWSDNTTDGFRGNTNTGFTHHITGATIDFPVNNMQNKIAFMCGNKDTLAWFYTNTAPPGWKIEPGGGDKVLAIRKDASDDKEGYPAETTFAGSWKQSNNHAHPIGDHLHQWSMPEFKSFDELGKEKNTMLKRFSAKTHAGVRLYEPTKDRQFYRNMDDNYTAKSPGDTGLGYPGQSKWRPAAAVGIVCRLDVA